MKPFDPPLKVGDLIRERPEPGRTPVMPVTYVGELYATARESQAHFPISLWPQEEGRTWERITPLAPGDEVVLIERRTGVVRVVSGETAIVGNVAAAPVNSLVPIELSAEGRDWERAK